MENTNIINLKFMRARREELGVTEAEIARAFGMKASSHYYKYENGDYQLKANMLPTLAKMLQCSIDDFFCHPARKGIVIK